MCRLRFVMEHSGPSDSAAVGSVQLAKAVLSRKQLSDFPEDEFSGQEHKVNIIDLSRNSLSSIPGTISVYTNLIELDISNNRISGIPDEIVALKHLRSLICKNNQLETNSLPKDFGKCVSLETVNFSGNTMLDFPMQFTEIQTLKAAYLGGNRIRQIPTAIQNLQRLERLYLGGNQLTSIPLELGSLPRLACLVLSDNRIETVPSELVNLRSLKSLSLHNNRITTLPPQIISLGDLCELSLRGNPLVVRFVRDFTWQPPSLLELAGRTIKNRGIAYTAEDLPLSLIHYLDSARHCLNPKCSGVYFSSRVEHIKFVDFCGKYRLPLMQYLCSPSCTSSSSGNYSSSSYTSSSDTESDEEAAVPSNKMKKVLLG
ncbi:leucine-rich repeat-containing protein 58-like [Patiria miniata]|uniref:Leucine-rich repeat-containing protein 58 n=1 Tax=Patiria miniata TaxID=46514 RepID=A0A914AFK4_PATMI|nr:leucine-rich repeat-containing protein 58-like [Patiria miniata]